MKAAKKTGSNNRFFFFFMLLTGIMIWSILVGGVTPATAAKIKDLTVASDEYDLKVSFILANCFNREIKRGILNGIPATFTFYLNLYRKNDLLFLDPLISHQWKHTIEYDNLQEQFRVLRYEEVAVPVFYKNFHEAQEFMARVDKYPVVTLKTLDRKTRHLVRVKAIMDEVRLPFNLESLLVFVSFWDFETPWAQAEVILPENMGAR